MYRIKPNGNYNVVINDLQVTLSATNQDGILLTDDQVEGSSDVARLKEAGYMLVEKQDEKKASKVKTKVEEVVSQPEIFVTHSDRLESNPTDVFVATAETLDLTETKEVEVEQGAKVLGETEVVLVEEVTAEAPKVIETPKTEKATKASKPKEAKATPTKGKATTKKSNK